MWQPSRLVRCMTLNLTPTMLFSSSMCVFRNKQQGGKYNSISLVCADQPSGQLMHPRGMIWNQQEGAKSTALPIRKLKHPSDPKLCGFSTVQADRLQPLSAVQLPQAWRSNKKCDWLPPIVPVPILAATRRSFASGQAHHRQ